MTLPDPHLIAQATNEICRNNFFPFVWKVFNTLHDGQGKTFDPSWHVRAMCFELDNVRVGENKRLIINIPPRCLKSVTVAVAFVAFLLGHNPHTKIIVASYGLDLARLHSENCRTVMQTQWYRAMFPDTRLGRKGNTSEEIRTTAGGGRKAVSIGSSVTGHGADYIIIDDLLKAGDASSEVELFKAQDFIEQTLLSRFDQPSEGRVVMVAQRLHEMDPPGYLLEKNTYRHLKLQAIAEEDETVPIGYGKTHFRAAGESLCPTRFDLETLAQKRLEMGSRTFNCQYQQNPVSPEDSPLRWEWFGRYENVQEHGWYDLVAQSWDTAASRNPQASCSVCTTWGLRNDNWYLLDVWRGQLDYPALKRKVLALEHRWQPGRVLIEDASSGKPLLDELFDQNRLIYRRIRPLENKEIRFQSALSPVEAGKVFLPREASWLPAFKRELLSFPNALKNDQVDSFSQFLNWTKTPGVYSALGRNHPLTVDRRNRNRVRERR